MNRKYITYIFIVGCLALGVNCWLAKKQVLGLPVLVYAEDDSCDSWEDCNKKKKEKEKELGELEVEKEETEENLESVGQEITTVGTNLTQVTGQLINKRQEIDQIEENKKTREEERLAKIALRNQLVRSAYKQNRTSMLELFVSSSGFSDLAKRISYYEAVVMDGQNQIATLGNEIQSLTETLVEEEERKVVLEGEVAGLATQKANLESEQRNLNVYLGDVTSQISGVEGTIQNITSRQQELIREKYSATAKFMTVGEWEEEFESWPSAPFDNAFRVVSIGYPHRIGMSQYGAYGRAKAGQNYEKILKEYYNNVDIGEYDCPDSIKVQTNDGTREIDFEDEYMKGIAEMPSQWGSDGGMEALKAQAIAARTYALAATDNCRNPICTSQSCQVWLESKAHDDRAKNWHEAVEETKGKVITQGGSPIKAYYASTAGGYTRLPTDFDVKWNRTFDYLKRIHDADEKGNAYDGPGHGNSPWYYKAWYSKNRGDEHPWLKEEEIRDLLNAALLIERDGNYKQHLSQEDPVISSDPGWSKEKVREALEDEGGNPIEKVRGIITIHSDSGYTIVLEVDTDDGKVEVDGKKFREIFVIRSRGYLALWSSLYDIVGS